MLNDMTQKHLDNFAEDIVNGLKLSDDELRDFISINEKEELEELFYVSLKVRDHFFGNKVFLYSFVYFST